MKKFISIVLVLILILSVFAGCSGSLSKAKKAELKNDFEYFNEKALDNIDDLLYTSFDHAEEWIQNTFSEDELNFNPIVNDGVNLGYVTTSRNLLLLFTCEDGRSDFIIEPYVDDLTSLEWCSENDIKEVNTYSNYISASIDGAPHYGIMTIYGFDTSPELRLWYNIGVENTAYLDFVYITSEFTLVKRD